MGGGFVMTDTNSLAGKYAIITGGTQGLGESAARLFAERGAAGIIICGRNAERGNAVADSITATGCETHFVQMDLISVEDCQRVIATADEKFGAVHILVNAGALTERGSIWDTTPELWDAMMEINVRAPFFLMQGAMKIMRRENIAGSIVNITSVAAHGGPGFLAPYSASKGALVILTKNVAYTAMRNQIRVNAINLGWMDTPGEDIIQRKHHTDDPNWLEQAEAGQPFNRLIKTDEAARAIAYLASDESGLMTGTVLEFDQTVIGAGAAPQPQIGEMGTE
jgi:NAD(P)-dependent dehydrogenase (short-subunit alcohol dehydrogenase family)